MTMATSIASAITPLLRDPFTQDSRTLPRCRQSNRKGRGGRMCEAESSRSSCVNVRCRNIDNIDDFGPLETRRPGGSMASNPDEEYNRESLPDTSSIGSTSVAIPPTRENQMVMDGRVPLDYRSGATYRLRRVRKRSPMGGFHISDEVAGLLDPPFGSHSVSRAVKDLEDALESSPNSSVSLVLEDLDTKDDPITASMASELLTNLCRRGKARIGLKLFTWIQERGLMLAPAAYTALLAALARSGPFHEVVRVFRAMEGAGVAPSMHASTAVMQALSRSGNWRAVVDHLAFIRSSGCRPDVMIFNCAIGACGRAEQLEHVEKLWQAMQDEGCRPNAGTISLLVSTFVRSNRHDLALEAYFHALSLDIPVSEDVYQGLICVTAKCGRWALALDLYSFMLAAGLHPKRVLLFNALISALSKIGQWRLAEKVYGEMREFGLCPDHFTWCSLSSALGRAKEFERAMALHEQMIQMGLAPTAEVCNAALLACKESAKWQHGVQILWQMERFGVRADVRSYTTVIRACEISGQPKVAMKVYDRMQRMRCRPNAYTFASLIRAHGHAKDWRQAMHIFEDMRLGGHQPNVFVYNALISALLEGNQEEMAESVVNQMRRYGVLPDACTLSLLALMEMDFTEGNREGGQRKGKNQFTWRRDDNGDGEEEIEME